MLKTSSMLLRSSAIATALLVGPLAMPSVIHAQAPAASAAPSPFVSYEGAPTGPGDRTLTVRVQLAPGETTSNTEIWVLYGENEDMVTRANARFHTYTAGQAKVTSTTSTGLVTADFIFPHSDNPEPNVKDHKPAEIKRGRTTYYKVEKKRGDTLVDSPVVSFKMPHKLTIMNFGDSYASGEGAPNRTGRKWANETCHRSNNAGQARAFNAVKAEFPGLALKWANFACSGAQVVEGILYAQPKAGFWPILGFDDVRVRPQIDQAKDWLADKGYGEMNIAMFSIGGNDVSFADYVQNYMVLPGELSPTDPVASNLRNEVNQTIPQLYRSLKDALDRNFDYDRILVSEYPDPMRGANGRYCDQPEWRNPASEYQAFDEAFLQPLNNSIRNTVSTMPKFTYVSGTMAASRGHGLCNFDDPYFNNNIGESIGYQGDPNGVVHPTRLGHKKIYEPVYTNALRTAIKDIRKKWDIAAAKTAAKASAEAKAAQAARERAAAEMLARVQRMTQLRPSGSGMVAASRAASVSAVSLNMASPAKKAEVARVIEEARKAPARAPKNDSVPDNTIADDDEKD